MGVGQRDTGADEPVDAAALGVGGGDVVGAAQVEGVVGDDHVDAAPDGLVDDGGQRVDGEQDGAHGLGRVAADEAVGVPVLGELGRGGGLEEGEDVGDGEGLGDGFGPVGLAHGEQGY